MSAFIPHVVACAASAVLRSRQLAAIAILPLVPPELYVSYRIISYHIAHRDRQLASHSSRNRTIGSSVSYRLFMFMYVQKPAPAPAPAPAPSVMCAVAVLVGVVSRRGVISTLGSDRFDRPSMRRWGDEAIDRYAPSDRDRTDRCSYHLDRRRVNGPTACIDGSSPSWKIRSESYDSIRNVRPTEVTDL